MRYILIRIAITMIICGTSVPSAMGAEYRNPANFMVIRLRDEIGVYIGRSCLAVNESIIFRSLMEDDNRELGKSSSARISLFPFLIKQAGTWRVAFPVLKPQISVSGGEVWQCRFVEYGHEVNTPDAMSDKGMYVIDILFKGFVPEEFVVTVQMTAMIDDKGKIEELSYKPSSDYVTGKLLYPEKSKFTLRVDVVPELGKWKVKRAGEDVATDAGSLVSLTPEVAYTIRPVQTTEGR